MNKNKYNTNNTKLYYFNFFENNIINSIFKYQDIENRLQFSIVNKKINKLFMNFKNDEIVVIKNNEYKLIDIYKNINFHCSIIKDIDNDELILYKNIYSLMIGYNNKINKFI